VTAGPYARLDAVYLLGALDADERLAYEAHLAICRRCRAGLAEISAIPSLLAGLDESVFAAPPEVAPTPVHDTLLPRLLQAAGRERARRRWLTTGLGPLAAACAIALIVIVVPSSSGPKPAPRAMAALVATPVDVDATIALQPRSWGTEIDVTCWYQRGAAEPSSDRYELAAHGADVRPTTWVAGDSPPARGSSSPAAPHSPRHRSRTSRSPGPTGPRSSHSGVPCLFRTADR
jgi:hypothetical protein